MKIVDQNDSEAINKRDEKIGREIAALLGLKKSKDETTDFYRYKTSYGTKTEIGLARSIKRIFEENGVK